MKPPLVLDCSVAVSWLMPDEQPAFLDYVVAHGAIVPVIWQAEVGNCLSVAVKRKRITAETAVGLRERLSDLPVSVNNDDSPFAHTFALTQKHDLSFYDATYLELAMRTGYPLATLDNALKRAAEAEGVFY